MLFVCLIAWVPVELEALLEIMLGQTMVCIFSYSCGTNFQKYVTVCVLRFMILVIFIILSCHWPYMPVKTNTAVGHFYYVCDLYMLLDVQNMPTINSKYCTIRFETDNVRFKFWNVLGRSGYTSLGGDVAPDSQSLHKEYIP